MSDFTGPGRNSDVDDEVGEVLGGELADQLPLPGGFDLEAAEGVGGADEREGVRIVEGCGVEFDAHPLRALDLVEGVGHRRLHAHPEDVEFEEAHVFDVVLVELTHRVPGRAGLGGCAVQEGEVGQDHTARVQGHMPWQAVEGFHQGEEPIERSLRGESTEGRGPQFRQVRECGAGVAGPHMREGLGQRIDFRSRHSEGFTDIAHRVPHTVGLHHRHAGHALVTEAFKDSVIHLGAPRGLDVDVDVREHPPQRGQEPLHQQSVPHGIDTGDPEEMVDQAAGTRSACGHAHTLRANHVHHLGDGEEVTGEPEVLDGAHLRGQAFLGGTQLTTVITLREGGAAPLPEQCGGLAHRIGDRVVDEDVEFGDEHLPESQIAFGLQCAEFGKVDRVGDEPVAITFPRGAGDFLGHLRHLRGRLQERFAVGVF